MSQHDQQILHALKGLTKAINGLSEAYNSRNSKNLTTPQAISRLGMGYYSKGLLEMKRLREEGVIKKYICRGKDYYYDEEEIENLRQKLMIQHDDSKLKVA